MSDILRYLFPVPKDDSRRVITFANQDDYISFRWVCGLSVGPVAFIALWLAHMLTSASFLHRHHVYKKTDHRNVELTEVGPRFELKCEFRALVYS